jgi:hypothetical protein
LSCIGGAINIIWSPIASRPETNQSKAIIGPSTLYIMLIGLPCRSPLMRDRDFFTIDRVLLRSW